MVQYPSVIDQSFAALSDPTRRGILERLGEQSATITELAEQFEMTLTGMKKHVQVLEGVGLVTTQKVGRARVCSLGGRDLEAEASWIANYRRTLEERYDRLAQFLEQTKGER